MIKSAFVVFSLVTVFTNGLIGQEKAVESNPNVESFEVVWKTIRDSHWDKSKVDGDWTRSYEELQPKIEAASSKSDARKIMMELIGTLGQSHFGIIPSDSYDARQVEKGGGNAKTGITPRIVDGQVVVTQVRSDSPADKSGVRPGWTITRIRDREISELIEKLGDKEATGPERLETTAGLVLESMLSDKKGKSISIEFKNESNETEIIDVPCAIPPGSKIAKLGHLPPIQVTQETRTLNGNIGYFRFSAFLDPISVMPAYRKAMHDPNHHGGIILDLRGNIGGLAAMTMGMAGEFVDEKISMGTMTMRDSELNFVVFPKGKTISAPVAVLVDECSISSAEILAGGLQDIGKARIFGSRTAGLALPSQVIKLPNGDGFQYAMADYHSASGKTLEKDGVAPDVVVELSRQNLMKDGDPVLKAAVEWINENNGG